MMDVSETVEPINSKELRIGNYVKQGIVEVINSTSAYCYIPKAGQSIAQKLCGNYYKFEDIKAMKITENILNCLGFNPTSIGWQSPNNKILFNGGDFKFTDNKEKLEISSVHQLQNLYYELYGEWLS